MNTSPKHALVVLSGGQDSVTCLALARATYARVSAISFVYGQRHRTELECASFLCGKYGIDQKIVHLDFLPALVTSALTGKGEVGLPHAYKPGLPSSFVPNRNAFFLTAAHAHAQEIGADIIMTGVCQTDYSGYPDCRQEFITHLGYALNIGYQTKIQILAPLMDLGKAMTFALADELGALDDVIRHSHTCYNGVRDALHDWGFGCGTCPACELRKKGWEEFKSGKLPGQQGIQWTEADEKDKAQHRDHDIPPNTPTSH